MTGVLGGGAFVTKDIFVPIGIRSEEACRHENFVAEVLIAGEFSTRACGLALRTKEFDGVLSFPQVEKRPQ